MSVLYIALPAALLIAALAVAGFVWSVRRGQFDDLSTPPVRMLFDDPPRKKPNANVSPTTPDASHQPSK